MTIRQFRPNACGRGLQGESVTFTKAGCIEISGALASRFDRKILIGCRLEYDDESRTLFLVPCPESPQSWRWHKDKHGRMLRISARAVCMELGLLKASTYRLDASWNEQVSRIEVSLSDNRADRPSRPKQDVAEDEPSDRKPTCQTCRYQRQGLCTCGVAPDDRRHKRVDGPPWKTACPSHPDSGSALPSRDCSGANQIRHGSRPKKMCPVCGKGPFAMSSSGLYPHDTNGVAFSAGRGDHRKKCAGSNMKE